MKYHVVRETGPRGIVSPCCQQAIDEVYKDRTMREIIRYVCSKCGKEVDKEILERSNITLDPEVIKKHIFIDDVQFDQVNACPVDHIWIYDKKGRMRGYMVLFNFEGNKTYKFKDEE